MDTKTLEEIPSPSPKLSTFSSIVSLLLVASEDNNLQAFHFKGFAMDHCIQADRGDPGNLTVNEREFYRTSLPWPKEHVPNLSALMELENPMGVHLLIQQG